MADTIKLSELLDYLKNSDVYEAVKAKFPQEENVDLLFSNIEGIVKRDLHSEIAEVGKAEVDGILKTLKGQIGNITKYSTFSNKVLGAESKVLGKISNIVTELNKVFTDALPKGTFAGKAESFADIVKGTKGKTAEFLGDESKIVEEIEKAYGTDAPTGEKLKELTESIKNREWVMNASTGEGESAKPAVAKLTKSWNNIKTGFGNLVSFKNKPKMESIGEDGFKIIKDSVNRGGGAKAAGAAGLALTVDGVRRMFSPVENPETGEMEGRPLTAGLEAAVGLGTIAGAALHAAHRI